MSQPEEQTALELFFRSLKEAPARVLLLDYDGTLAPFHVERDRAFPYEGCHEVVRAILLSGHTRLVVISGRGLLDLRRLLGVEPPPELWGTHGWERLERGGPHRLREVPRTASTALKRAREALSAPEFVDFVEVKPASLAVHRRGLSPPQGERLMALARAAWEPLAREAGLDLHTFEDGLELRIRGWNKGDAVRAVLDTEPTGTAVAYLGDDLTDEDAFRALADLAAAGRVSALSVLVGEEPRPSCAAIRLRPSHEVLAFLRRWFGVMG